MGISKISQCRKQPACYHQAIESPFWLFYSHKRRGSIVVVKNRARVGGVGDDGVSCWKSRHSTLIGSFRGHTFFAKNAAAAATDRRASVDRRRDGLSPLFYLRQPETVCSRFPEAQIRVKTQIVWFNMVDERRCAWMAIRSWLVRSQHQSTAIWSDHHNVTLTEGLSINMEIVVSCVD